MTVLNIISVDEARIWNAHVSQLNEEMYQLLIETGQTMQDLRGEADSEIIDIIYNWGSQIVEAAPAFLKGMNEIVAAINSAISSINETLESGREKIRTILQQISDF